jgi:hypothetical protein
MFDGWRGVEGRRREQFEKEKRPWPAEHREKIVDKMKDASKSLCVSTIYINYSGFGQGRVRLQLLRRSSRQHGLDKLLIFVFFFLWIFFYNVFGKCTSTGGYYYID